MKLGRKTSRRDQRQRVSPNEVDAMLKLAAAIERQGRR